MMLTAGCSSLTENIYRGSVQYAHKSDLKPGMSIDQAKQTIPFSPTDTRTFPGPSSANKTMTAVEFNGAIEEYLNVGKHWLLFEDNKLVAEGAGTAKEAEMYWYAAFYDDLRDSSKISRAETERKKYQKLQQLYGVTPYENEYFTYRIVVAGKLDRKEIDDDMANYLLAQKKNEVTARLDVARQNALTQEMVNLQRTALFMQTMATIQTVPTVPTRSSASCTTNRFGNTWYTNCY